MEVKNVRKGIAVAGNMMTDLVKDIRYYPEKGMLSVISDVSRAVGGCAPNTAIDLAKIDPELSVSTIGCVGKDENGEFLIFQMQKNGVNTDMITVTDSAPTSFSDIMSLPNGERTIFSFNGANDVFSPNHIDISRLNCRNLHIGYILLLGAFDAPDAKYGTVMARFLKEARENGIKTSVDVVSRSDGEFAQKIIPVLKYVDYIIINEIECCGIWGLSPRFQNGRLDIDTIRLAMEKTMDAGDMQKVIVHCKEAGFCLSHDRCFTKVGSLEVESSLFKGSVGAGDAFCAGCLYGIYNGFSDKQMLEFASAAAVCSLFEANSVDGMRNKAEILEVMNTYPRISI